MLPLPHVYSVTAAGHATGNVTLHADGAPRLLTAAPAEFDGPGDQWSPESMLTGAIASCFILSFRAVARAARIAWLRLEVEVAGTLERSGGTLQFTNFVTRVVLTVPETADAVACEGALAKAEHGCIVANSLNAVRELQIEVVMASLVEPVAQAS
jgi:organic hydroperoxide reductase OsmC/OhrA